MNKRQSRRQVSHAKRWFSWMLIALFIIYVAIAWYLERISVSQWITSLSPDATALTALLLFIIRFTRHIIPVLVGGWFAYNATVQTVERLYDLPDKASAQTFLKRLRSPNIWGRWSVRLNDQTLAQDRAGSVILQVGGPGKVKVSPRDAAVTEDNGRFARVLGPGIHLLMPYEYVHAVLDLREQERHVTDVSLRTRDNIDLTASFTVVYRIRRGDNEPTKSRPYPFVETAVRTAAYAYTVLGEDMVGDWRSKPAATTRTKLARVIANYSLDEIIHPPGRTEEPYRIIQQEVLRSARNELARSGIELLSVHINQLKPPKAVEAQYIEYWRTQWESKVRLSEADGEATALEEIEVARAEAEVAMMQAILEGIQRARRSGATSRTSEVVALRLVEGLERLAEQSKQSQANLPVLEQLRAERLSYISTLPNRSAEGTEPS